LKLSDKALIKDLRDALIVLPAVFILEMEGVETDKLSENLIVTGKIKPDELLGFDFVVFDENIKNLNKYLELGIVPIAPVKNPLKSVLKEFNPMKNE
jgi:hypothetical protein